MLCENKRNHKADGLSYKAKLHHNVTNFGSTSILCNGKMTPNSTQLWSNYLLNQILLNKLTKNGDDLR